LAKEAIRTVYGARRRSDCYRLMDLYRTRMGLMRRLLALLPLMGLSVALFGLALYVFFLLRSMLLQDMRLHHLAIACLSLTQLALSFCVCLLR
jgi:hypothetical protein